MLSRAGARVYKVVNFSKPLNFVVSINRNEKIFEALDEILRVSQFLRRKFDEETSKNMETSQQDSIVRALRRLTIAVWALTAVVGVFVGMYLAAYLFSWSYFNSSANVSRHIPAAVSKSETRYSDISELPLEKRIDASSVILVTKYQTNGDRNKCVISEILKLVPGTKFQYNIGDEFQQCSHYLKSDESRGDGQLVFFVGNPAEYRYSSMIYGGNLSGFGNMPIDLLRKQISDTPK